jgi:hypothetical protein
MHRAHSVLALVLTCAFAAGCDPEPTVPRDEELPACEQDDRIYVSTDLAVCDSVLFICEAGFEPFEDECGCGCEPSDEDPNAALDVKAVAAGPP